MVQYTHKLISIINHIDRLKHRNHMIMSKDTKKALGKVQNPIMVSKSYGEMRTRGTYLNIVRLYMENIQPALH